MNARAETTPGRPGAWPGEAADGPNGHPDAGALRIAVDVGGTFTDIVVLDGEGELRVGKVPSTSDPVDGVLDAIGRLGVDLREAVLFSHGTTVATNALVTRRLPTIAMVTTKGFRDVIEIRKGTKEDLWDTYKDVAPPYVRRRDRYVVQERVDAGGRVLETVDEDEVRTLGETLRARGYEAVAVCFMNSYANPENERSAATILRDALPGVVVSASAEVLPELFEHERFSTTVVNAVLGPLVTSYTQKLEDQLQSKSYVGDLLILHSGGGVMTPASAGKLAARIAGSGIAAGAIASRHIALLCGYRNSIGLDMGGTSTDISLTYGGEIRVTKDWYIEYGYPICFPSVEVRTIGAGGGSIAWIDDAGSLRNGPQSAGSNPGPACYAQGGLEATNTDANLILGRLGSRLIGGEMHLDESQARKAIDEKVGGPLGLNLTEAAAAIIQVANANMGDAVRVTSIRRGYDPRDFALVAFGGAGPLHGAALARDLSIPTVLVPPNPGITSALGCLLVDVRHDLSSMFVSRVEEADPAEVEAEFARLEVEAKERLEAERIDFGSTHLARSIDMRYHGQWRSIAVPVSRPLPSVEDLVEQFHILHEREHTFRRDGGAVEMYRLNLTAVGATQKAELRKQATHLPAEPAEPRGRRQVFFDEAGAEVATDVYWRDELLPGAKLRGPAIIEQLDSTTLIPPDVPADIDEWRNIRIYVGEV